MFAPIVTAWTWFTQNKWAQYLALGIAMFLGIKAWQASIEKGVRRQERDAEKLREQEERARIVETVTQVGQETQDAKDRAIAAADAVTDVHSADELRERYPENAAIILRSSPAGGGKGPR